MKEEAARRASEVGTNMVEDDSDSDDSVIHVPYVKPSPPVISLDESDGEVGGDQDPPVDTADESVEALNSSNEASFSQSVSSSEPVAVTDNDEDRRKKKKKSKTKENNSRQKEKSGKNKDKQAKKKKPKDKTNNTSNADQSEVNPVGSKTKKKQTKKKDKSKTTGDSASKNQEVLNGVAGIMAEDGFAETSDAQNIPHSKNQPGTKRKKRATSETDSTVSSSSTNNKKGAKRKTPTRNSGVEEENVQVLGHAPAIRPRQKRRRKDIGTAEQVRTLTPADIDHLNFLKTLNLTGNIGFDENDLLNMALSPADFGGTNLMNSLISCGNATLTPAINCEAGRVSPPKTGEHVINHDETSSMSSVSSEAPVPGVMPVHIPSSSQVPTPLSLSPPVPISVSNSSSGAIPKPLSPSPRVPQSPECSPSTNSQGTKKKVKETPRKSPGFVSVVEDKSKSKKKRDLSNPKAAAIPNSVPQMRCNAKGSDDEADREGIFTTEELDQVRSHLQLHVTGVAGVATIGKDSAKQVLLDEINVEPGPSSNAVSSKLSFRYFNKSSGDQNIEEVSRGDSTGKRKNESDEHRQRKKRKPEGEDSSSDLMRPPKLRAKATKKSVNTPRLMKTRPYPTTWSADMIDFYGKVDPQVPDVDEILSKLSNTPRIWRIPVDLKPCRIKGRQIRCDNCNQYGFHPPNRCPEPKRQKKCVMCGEVGHETNCLYPTINNQNIEKQYHVAEFSKRSVRTTCNSCLCLNCGKKVRKFNKNGMGEFVQRCDSCPKKHDQKCGSCAGRHVRDQCPDDWRRFHSVVAIDDAKFQELKSSSKEDEPLFRTTYKPIQQLFCCNCAERGHNYYNCKQKKGFNSTYLAVKPIIHKEVPLSIVEALEADEETTLDGQPKDLPLSNKSVPVIQADKQVQQDKDATVNEKGVGYSLSNTSLQKAQVDTDANKAGDSAKSLVEKAPSPITITIEDDVEIIELDSSVDNPKKVDSNMKVSAAETNLASSSQKSPEKRHINSEGVIFKNHSLPTRPHFQSGCEIVGHAFLAPKTLESGWRNDRNPKQQQEMNRRIEERSDHLRRNFDEDFNRSRIKSTPPSRGDRLHGDTRKDKNQTGTRCRDFPECQNSSSKPCVRITLKKSEHKLILRTDQDMKLVEKLNQLYANQRINICLSKNVPEFHISGDKNYLPRDRILRLVKDLADQRDVSKLFGIQSSSSQVKDGSGNLERPSYASIYSGTASSSGTSKERDNCSTQRSEDNSSISRSRENCNASRKIDGSTSGSGDYSSTSMDRENPTAPKERASSSRDTSNSSSVKDYTQLEEQSSSGTTKDKDQSDLIERHDKDQQGNIRGECNPNDLPISSTSTGNRADLFRQVFSESAEDSDKQKSAEAVPPVSTSSTPAQPVSTEEVKSSKDGVTSTSDEPEKQTNAPLSQYEFERKLRKLVCSVPFSSTSSEVPENSNSKAAGQVSSTTDSTTTSSNDKTSNRSPPIRRAAGSNKNSSTKPIPQRIIDNSARKHSQNFSKRNKTPNNVRRSYDSRFDRSHIDYNRSQFGDPDSRNYFSPNVPPQMLNNNYPNSHFMNIGAGGPPQMGYDIDERNLSYAERQQFSNEFRNPSSPFCAMPPWTQDNYPGPGDYRPPPDSFQPQFGGYSNEDFRNDNFNNVGFDGPRNFDGFFIDRQPGFPQPPMRFDRPRQPRGSLRHRGRGRGYNRNSNNRRR